jgi:hypothetical protein
MAAPTESQSFERRVLADGRTLPAYQISLPSNVFVRQ